MANKTAIYWSFPALGGDLEFRDAHPETLVLKTNEGNFPLSALPPTYVNYLLVDSVPLLQYVADHRSEE